jgi:hypothetical protein
MITRQLQVMQHLSLQGIELNAVLGRLLYIDHLHRIELSVHGAAHFVSLGKAPFPQKRRLLVRLEGIVAVRLLLRV